jgi:hypothetical protein
MNSTCSQLQDDWELYALGSLPEDAQESMTAHLESGCRDCRERYFEAQMAVTAMSSLAPTHQPSPNVERKLMRAIQADRVPNGIGWSFWKVVPWAVAFACLLVTLWLARDRSRLHAELAAQSRQPARREQSATLEEVQGSPEAAQHSPGNGATTGTAPAIVVGGQKAVDETKWREQLDEARRQAQLAEADKAEMQRQVEQLRTDLSAATNRTTALEKDLQLAKEQVAKEIQQEGAAHKESEQVAALAAELAQSQDEVRRLSEAARNSDRIQRLLQSASLREISLRSVVPQAGHATARALYSSQGGLLLVADSLPKLPDQKCYQLWLIRRGSPSILSGGLITLENDGKGTLFAPPSADLAEVTALAITDEPAGGSVAARGKKLLFGAQ